MYFPYDIAKGSILKLRKILKYKNPSYLNSMVILKKFCNEAHVDAELISAHDWCPYNNHS